MATLYQYNGRGQVEYSAVDMNTNGTIDFDGSDRITQTISDVTSDHGNDVRRTRTYVWKTDGDSSPTLVSVAETSTDGLRTWQTQYRDASTPVTSTSQTTYGSGGSRTVMNTAPDGSYTISTYSYGRLVSSIQYDSTGEIGGTTYTYDSQGRQYQVIDARNGATTYGYNDADLVTSVTTPPPGPGQAQQTTVTYYNSMLQATNIVQPDGGSVVNEYLPSGELKETHGSRTYPVTYTYDYAGRMKTMTTWQDYSGNSGQAVTTWNYSPQRGFLIGKTYADGSGPTYSYTAAGRLRTRTWARGITTTYGYDNGGDLAAVSYSDSTPGVTYTYDREGRQSTVTDNGATDTLAYNDANEPLSETYSGGSLAGLAITNGYDSDLRRTVVATVESGNALLQQTFGYDTASRLQTAQDGAGGVATYSYVANSPLVGQIAFAQNGTTRMTTSKQYDNLNRLIQIHSTPTASPSVNFDYQYNAANQRIRATLTDGSYWLYQYDSLGQLTSAHKYWGDQSPVAGQQFDYAFDTIGNRKSTETGGDQHGWNQRRANYSVNDLNQYTSRDVPGYVDILGVSFATNTVTVNGNAAYRKGEYFRDELSVDNSAAPVWEGVTVSAAGQNPVNGNVFVPQTPQQFGHDADGNLTSDGRWNYTWDGENRLVQMVSATGVGPQELIKFEYDWQGRRIRKEVWNNTSGTGNPVLDERFVYDGWNLIAVLSPQSSVLASFMWGNDLSGSPQGAGGVGGLLEVSASGTNCFVAFDGNGNVAALVNAGDGTTVANYEYGPFGELIRQTGPMATANPFRFSTKYQDDESDLLYYGHRYYAPSTGRWLSRDPGGEDAGEINLYCFVCNDPMDDFDDLGLMRWEDIMNEVKQANSEIDSIPCCCTKPPPTTLHESISGTSSGTTATGKATIEKHGCILTVWGYYWWDCYSAASEGDAWINSNWKDYGWSEGGETYSKTAKPHPPDTWFNAFDPYHLAMDSAVIFTGCYRGHVHAFYTISNELEWTWNKKTKSWTGPTSTP